MGKGALYATPMDPFLISLTSFHPDERTPDPERLLRYAASSAFIYRTAPETATQRILPLNRDPESR
jgi:hypothetical protein